jgi:FtsP/CotA-like multicopper oxidase with cupredoxin domain
MVQRGAVLKDTVIVPSGGYVVVRFPATTPGIWFLHCHIDMHSNDGMAMVLHQFYLVPYSGMSFELGHLY